MEIKIATISDKGTVYASTEEEAPEMLAEYEALGMYDETLDECYEPYNMGGMEYMPSDILKECDPIAYRVGFSDYADSLAEDGTPVEGWV